MRGKVLNGIKLWLNGYVVVCINGREKERFISLCKNKCIKIYNLKLVDNKYICEISIAEYKNIYKIVSLLNLHTKYSSSFSSVIFVGSLLRTRFLSLLFSSHDKVRLVSYFALE